MSATAKREEYSTKADACQTARYVAYVPATSYNGKDVTGEVSMAQKSRHAAAKYAAQSRERKTKRRVAIVAEPVPRSTESLAPAPASRPTATTRSAEATRSSGPVPAVQKNTRARSTTQIIASDYRYVVQDLRQILMVSGILLAAIIALAFVLH